jgi:VanZ family protein
MGRTPLRSFMLFAPPLALATLIFWLSAQEQLPSTPGGDKLAHAVTYGTLAALALRALYFGIGYSTRTVVVLAPLLAALYGVSDELHQSFVPGRDASIGDVIADVTGAVLGAIALWSVYRWRKSDRS